RMRQQPKKKKALEKQKANLLQTQGVLKSLYNKNRTLLKITPWAALPSCSYSKPSHPRLPKELVDFLKHCEEAPISVGSEFCPVPAFFSLQWIESLQCFYCKMHKCLVFGDYIWKHIARSHQGKFSGISRTNVLEGFLGHIQKCYPTIVSQLTEILKNHLPDSLPQPLSSLPIIQRYKCTVQECTTWSTVNVSKGAANANHIKHIKTHKISGEIYKSAASIEPQWTQLLKFGLMTCSGSSVIVIVPHNQSDNSAFPILTSAIIAGAAETWAIELGWDEELNCIANALCMPTKDTISKLKDLVELPSQDRVLQAEGNIFKLIEQGLRVLNRLNIQYFSDMISWIEAKHYSFQQLFGNDRKPLYLPKNNQELYRTRRLHCAMETMIIRSLSESIVTQKQNTVLKCSKAAKDVGCNIIQLFLKDGGLDHENLLTLKHQLFIELLKGSQRTASKVGDISEQALLALSLLPSGKWRKAVYVRSYVYGGLWSFRGTFANWARLQDSPYLSLDKHSLQDTGHVSLNMDMSHQAPINSGSDDEAPEVPEEFEEDEGDNEDGVDERDSEDGVDDDFLETFDSIQLQSQDDEALLQRISSYIDLHLTELDNGNFIPVAFDEFIEANRKYVDIKDAITPIGRLKMINSLLYKYSVYKPPFSSTFYNGSFLISNGHDCPVPISLQKIKCCLLSSQQKLLCAMKNVLPIGLDLSKLPLHHIHDDFSPVPLHLQPHNKALLDPHLNHCWTEVLKGNYPGGSRLLQKFGLDCTQADQWLEACGHCFSLACASIFLSTGGANFSSLRHQQYAGQGRTVFLLKDGILAFTNPSSLKSSTILTLIAVTPELSQYLLILFLIVLPTSIQLRRFRGQQHPYDLTHLWVTYHQHKNGHNRWLYNEKLMNADLEVITKEAFGFPITCRNLYHIVFGVLRKDFPSLFTDLSQNFMSPVDDLAQHSYSTGIVNYGKLTVFPRFHNNVGDQPWRHLTICQLWQASLGCISVKDTWKGLVKNANLFSHISSQLDLAFQTARDQVRHTYGISSCPDHERHGMVADILQSRPFLKGITAASGSIMKGDQALSSVLKTLLAGENKTEKGALISAGLVADAATLIVRALCEWADGSYVDLSQPTCNMALQLEKIRQDILEKIKSTWKISQMSFQFFQQ
ncbi:hypothetical protein V8E53_000004, partial [Lactarius tabidus]